MVLDNIESNFEFDPCTNYLVTPRLPVQDVTRQQYETLILGPMPTKWNYIGLGTGGAEGLSPSIFWVEGLEYPWAPQKILNPYKKLD